MDASEALQYMGAVLNELKAENERLRESLDAYTEIDRCLTPIKVPLPNPQGYASNVECKPCGKCRYCLARAALGKE